LERETWTFVDGLFELTVEGAPIPTAFFQLDSSRLDSGRLGY
jgi:hypothetical protein